jgi:hypothetical protein
MRKFVRFLPVLLLFLSLAVSAADGDLSFKDWQAADQKSKLHFMTLLILAVNHDSTVVRLPATYYVRELDSLVANTEANEGEAGMAQSIGYSFKTIAVMDCDWDNGQDRLEYAKKLMGPDIFAVFQKNYPDKYRRIVNGCR